MSRGAVDERNNAPHRGGDRRQRRGRARGRGRLRAPGLECRHRGPGPGGIAAAVDEVRAVGGRALGYRADVADPRAVDRAADAFAEEFGGIDVWVNNAMVTVYAEVAQMSPDEFRRVTEVTYLVQVHGTAGGPAPHAGNRIAAPSCMSARLWLTGRSRCNRPIAPPSRRCAASSTACARVAASPQRYPPHHGAATGGEHAAIRLGPLAPAAPPSRCRRSSSPRRSPRRSARRPRRAARALDRAPRRGSRSWARKPARLQRPLPRPARLSGRDDRRAGRARAARQPVRPGRCPHDHGAHGGSTGRPRAASSRRIRCGCISG